MRDRWLKIKKMPQSESTMKTAPSTTKRFPLNMLVNQVTKFFGSSNHTQQGSRKAKAFFTLPSISVTSPEGETTMVE